MPKIVQLQSPNRPRTTIGQMRQEIKVLTYADSPFGAFELDRTYVEVATVRARVTNISGSASREGKGIDANITHTMVIRKPEFALTTENMIEWVHPGDNEYMRIRQVRPVGKTSNDPREQFVMMLCESQGIVDSFIPAPQQILVTGSGEVGFEPVFDIVTADLIPDPTWCCAWKNVSDQYLYLHASTAWFISYFQGRVFYTTPTGYESKFPPKTTPPWVEGQLVDPAPITLVY